MRVYCLLLNRGKPSTPNNLGKTALGGWDQKEGFRNGGGVAGVRWICDPPEPETEFTVCFSLTFRLTQIEMAELISFLIYDMAKRDNKLLFSCLSD